jgi:UDP-N-acetylmuramate--alanine ligase
MKTFAEAKKFHLIGVKGVGMTALAQVLLSMGKHVQGSDRAEVFFTDEILKKQNIQVTDHMGPENITNTIDWVVYSPAWDKHPETETARAKGIPTYSYPEVLGMISQTKTSIGVSGTHGKTTTSALLALAMIDLGLDPLAVIGSQVPQFGYTNAYPGQGDYLVAETCEYRRHFLHFHPSHIILTNIEADHLDYFKDIDDIIGAFRQYVERLPAQGTLFACIDSPGVRKLLTLISRTDIKIITYGESEDANYRLVNHTIGNNQQSFQVHENGTIHAFQMSIPGKHNCLNATAVIALCDTLFSKDESSKSQVISRLQSTIKGYRSTTRRLERIGEYKNITLYDDYGHHPTEISASLAALRGFYPQHEMIVAFMPHTYTRTQTMMDEFAQAFGDANEVIINEIYASARETPIAGVDGEALAAQTSMYHPTARYLTKEATKEYIKALPQSKQYLFLTIGAGDNWKITHHLLHPNE